MPDPFRDEYYRQSGENFELAKKAYAHAHGTLGELIEKKLLARFDLNDPKRSKATLQSVEGIRRQFETFEDRLRKVEIAISFARIQRNQFVTTIGLTSGNAAFETQHNPDSTTDGPLDVAHEILGNLRRTREGLAAASTEMDIARRVANLQVGALCDAISVTLLARMELVSAFADTELPVTAVEALKAIGEVSAEKAAEQIGEALVEAVKAVAPEIAAELVRIGSIVRTYRALAKAFGARDVDTTPNAVEAVQRLWDAMEAESEAFVAIDRLADKVADEMRPA